MVCFSIYTVYDVLSHCGDPFNCQVGPKSIIHQATFKGLKRMFQGREKTCLLNATRAHKECMIWCGRSGQKQSLCKDTEWNKDCLRHGENGSTVWPGNHSLIYFCSFTAAHRKSLDRLALASYLLDPPLLSAFTSHRAECCLSFHRHRHHTMFSIQLSLFASASPLPHVPQAHSKIAVKANTPHSSAAAE